jgi:predicted DNA-binding transcriptional regulator YafY
LNESGIPIISIAGVGYQLMEGFFLAAMVFTPSEAKSLFLAAKMLKANSAGRTPKDLELAIGKISSVLSESAKQEASSVADSIHFISQNQQFNLENPKLLLLQKAIGERWVVLIKYCARNKNQITERQIEPQKLSYFDNTWYVDGFCRLRHETRAFRLTRIEGLTLLNEKFEQSQTEHIVQDTVVVQVEFESSIARWVRENQHYGFQNETINKLGVVMNYAVNDLTELKHWLLGWGAHAQPISPLEFCELMQTEISKMQTKFLT